MLNRQYVKPTAVAPGGCTLIFSIYSIYIGWADFWGVKIFNFIFFFGGGGGGVGKNDFFLGGGRFLWIFLGGHF